MDEPKEVGKADTPGDSAATVRDYLANERTLLAWLRSGIALMVLGFAVARLGLTHLGAGTAVVREVATTTSSILGTSRS